jgi:hypothetical protein
MSVVLRSNVLLRENCGVWGGLMFGLVGFGCV